MADDPRLRSSGPGAAADPDDSGQAGAAGPGAPRYAAAAGPGAPGRAAADRGWLREAIELSRRCPPSRTAFSVGAILVSAAGQVLATGFSREDDPADHAEETALAKVGAAAQLAGEPDLLAGATLYSSLEPCLRRASRPRPCAQLIVASGIKRVAVAWLEPPLFVTGGGAAWLRAAGVAVVEFPELAGQARAANAHLIA